MRDAIADLAMRSDEFAGLLDGAVRRLLKLRAKLDRKRADS